MLISRPNDPATLTQTDTNPSGCHNQLCPELPNQLAHSGLAIIIDHPDSSRPAKNRLKKPQHASPKCKLRINSDYQKVGSAAVLQRIRSFEREYIVGRVKRVWVSLGKWERVLGAGRWAGWVGLVWQSGSNQSGLTAASMMMSF